MTRVFLFLITLKLAFVALGKQQNLPDIPPPITFTPVVNNSLEVTIANPETIVVKENIKVTIDCEPVIDFVRNSVGSNPRVVWYKNGIILTNGSEVNVYISRDNRLVIISRTSVAEGGQLGTSGNYRCCACVIDSNVDCFCNTTTKTVCGEPHLIPPANPPTVLPTFISLTFGQNVTVSTLVGVFSLIINLAIFNGTQPLNTTFYKDGSVIMSSSSNSLIISNPTDDNFGTYTVIVSSESCGAAYAISRIFQGVYLTFDENAYVFKEDGNEAKLNLSLSRPLRRNITVNFMYRDLSAIGNHSTNNTEDIDYYTSYSSPYGLIFPAYSTTITFELKIVNDSRLERNELFRIAAISPELPEDQFFSEPDIIILDDDDFKITFEMDHYVIDMNQVVKLLLRYPEVYDGFTIFPINVTVDKVNATATGKNADLENENEAEKALIIDSIDDNLEPNETFILIIKQDTITTAGRNNGRVIVGEYSRAIITIMNEPPELVIRPRKSPLIVTVGDYLPIHCIAEKGVPIPQVQWHSEGFPVYPSRSFYQQTYVVPTDSPHTTTYTCVGTSEEVIELNVSVTVIVEEPCPRLRAPRRGEVTITEDGQLAFFSCKQGFTMRGSYVLKCRNGKWDSSPPTCNSISQFCRRRCNF